VTKRRIAVAAGCLAFVTSGCGSESPPDARDGAGAGGVTGDAGPEARPDGGKDATGGANGDTAGAPDTAADAGGDAGADEPLPALPGTVTVRIVNDTEGDFKIPDEVSFRISVVGSDAAPAEVHKASGKYEAVMIIPAGHRELRLQERDGSGGETIDYFQDATRSTSVDVVAADNVSAEFHLKWHWQPVHVPGTDRVPACRGLRQLHFRDALHGMMTLKIDNNAVADYGHASALLTEDGGLTWTVGSELMIADAGHPFRPSPGYWWGTHELLALPDGNTVLSLSESELIARSGDGGKTWSVVPFSPPAWGTPGSGYGGLARSGSYIYVGANAGGVQGSSERTSISRSLDGGKTFQVVLDRCDRNEPTAACGSVAQPNLPLHFAGIDLACGPAGHCVSIGVEQVLATQDDFSTFTTFSALPPGFGCGAGVNAGRVVWVTGTDTVWVIVPASGCGNPPPMRRVSNDGGKTWGDWQASPASSGGSLQFGDANNGFKLEVIDLAVTHDGGKTFRSTGPAPREGATYNGFRLSVADAEHAWVSAESRDACSVDAFSYLAAWKK
jgi:hypothetical protein